MSGVVTKKNCDTYESDTKPNVYTYAYQLDGVALLVTDPFRFNSTTWQNQPIFSSQIYISILLELIIGWQLHVG